MCDTFVALGNATYDGSVIFGKNSDREPNEAQELVLIPHAMHEKKGHVNCTYINIPQVPETNAVLLSKPFWIWGAEMGANEHGVVIGNEAVFTKVPYQKEPGLIGMDFIRLALERATSAEGALDVIIDLLENYGQGGNCGFSHKMYYHNGFLIADRHEAWVLETAGKHWAAEKVQEIRSISNVISIRSHWDRASDELVSFAVSKGWCKDEDDFDFSRCYSDLIFTTFAAGRHRSSCTTNMLRENIGQIDIPLAMRILRDHGSNTEKGWIPGKGLFGAEVCMHASLGIVRSSQTTGSMISHLKSDRDVHWLSGTAAPCTSVYKPVWFDSGLQDLGPSPSGLYEEAALWWRHENLHREILRDYTTRITEVASGLGALQKEFLSEIDQVAHQSLESRRAFTQYCFSKAELAELSWLEKVKHMPVQQRRPLLDKIAWKKFDKQAARTQ